MKLNEWNIDKKSKDITCRDWLNKALNGGGFTMTYEADQCNVEALDGYQALMKAIVGKTYNEEKNMRDFTIVDYKVYDNKVVVVKFEDGTEERAICCESDNFDLERGIEVCTLKHIFGVDAYKAFLKKAMKQVKAVDAAKEEDKRNKEMIAKRRAAAARRKARYKANKRQRRVNEMKDAFLAAMKEYNSTETAESN